VRYLNPLPRNLGEILNNYEKVLVPELNLGQLSWLLRARFLKDIVGLNKVKGKPFTVGEVAQRIRELLS
jgi:2-oxoglutarate ferredoxin oxidoreductase subunit alpha